MQPHLIFTLTANLAAMGDLAGHERRGSLNWPGRSALIGLLGAALGRERTEDFSDLDALSLAVAVFDQGDPLRDYHSIETVPTAAAKKPNSRPQALLLANGRTNTTITLRDYRTAPLYGVAVWGGALEPLRAALEKPEFTLYLGRKACPLAAPLGARIVEAESAEEALGGLILPPWRGGAAAWTLVVDAEKEERHAETRQDSPRDRRLWHFDARRVAFRSVRIQPKGRPS